jgi:Protein of unknown function (DUF2905)
VETIAKFLLLTAAILAVAGGALLLFTKLGITRLPGDLVIRKGGFTLYAPIGLMIVLSLVATLVLSLIARR